MMDKSIDSAASARHLDHRWDSALMQHPILAAAEGDDDDDDDMVVVTDPV